METQTKKQKLISALKLAVHGLENDTVKYAWEEQCSCNCGVVSQAILGVSAVELKQKIKQDAIFSDRRMGAETDKTWKNGVKTYCSITGKTNESIFKNLFENGLSQEDICHLEYLENPAILKRAGMNPKLYTGEIEIKIKTGTEDVVIKRGFLGIGKLVGKKDVYKTVKEQVISQTTQEHYNNKVNLIKYLKAWVSILEEEQSVFTNDTDKNTLSEELLKSVAGENYERAAELRDLIAMK